MNTADAVMSVDVKSIRHHNVLKVLFNSTADVYPATAVFCLFFSF